MKPIMINQEVNDELEAVKRKLGMLKDVVIQGLPRTFSRKNVRFELPLDRKSLKGQPNYMSLTKLYKFPNYTFMYYLHSILTLLVYLTSNSVTQ